MTRPPTGQGGQALSRGRWRGCPQTPDLGPWWGQWAEQIEFNAVVRGPDPRAGEGGGGWAGLDSAPLLHLLFIRPALLVV